MFPLTLTHGYCLLVSLVISFWVHCLIIICGVLWKKFGVLPSRQGLFLFVLVTKTTSSLGFFCLEQPMFSLFKWLLCQSLEPKQLSCCKNPFSGQHCTFWHLAHPNSFLLLWLSTVFQASRNLVYDQNFISEFDLDFSPANGDRTLERCSQYKLYVLAHCHRCRLFSASTTSPCCCTFSDSWNLIQSRELSTTSLWISFLPLKQKI